ncbi:MAG: cysteine--tRNA ligase [Candidatus Cloacimonetes bacterium]|nr:cysteine--tRNA ligase [Candidatus Cloacimonadota bacterium]
MEIYNTLTKRKEIFKPIQENEVDMYVCGPTTYNYFHIGNGRAFLFFDIVRNYFKFLGMKVNYIQNITDIDDKLINQAKAEKLPIEKISNKYIKAFFEDIKALEIKKATQYPRATEYIRKMIDFIEILVKKGNAYHVEGDVFFSVKSIKSYGKLSGKIIDELITGARVEEDTKKKHPADFVLWKKNKPGEPKWKSPWGYGRPGWHTECVVMSHDIFQKTFDIHCGGTDLVFPHHENEIAQAEAATGKPLANYWMHNGFINIEGEKMSKSLDNFFTVRDVLKKYNAETIRHFYLSKHYRSPIDFNVEALQSSKAAVKRLYQPFRDFNTDELKHISKLRVIKEYREEFMRAMNDDFNTAQAIAIFFDIAKTFNNSKTKDSQRHLLQTLRKLGNVLGFFQYLTDKLEKDAVVGSSNEIIELLIGYREKFKTEKNWFYADMIRNDLKKLGIILQDTPEGTKWKFEKEE